MYDCVAELVCMLAGVVKPIPMYWVKWEGDLFSCWFDVYYMCGMRRKKSQCLCCVLIFTKNARYKYVSKANEVQVGFLSFLVYNHNYIYWHFATRRRPTSVLLSSCLWACTSLSWLVLRWTSVVIYVGMEENRVWSSR